MTAAAPDASTFNPGIHLLPDDLKPDVRQLYRVLRTIDDLVDEDDPQAERRVEAVERWAHGQVAETQETRLLTELCARHPLPPQALIEFCCGMRHDLNRGVIDTEDTLERYCQHVGGAVGRMLARIFGGSQQEGENKLAILGRAFQRTHILRDIDEDRARGRLYIAATTIDRFGFPAPGARAELLRDQIARAEQLYEQGSEAITFFPRAQQAIALTVALYREILRQIEREGYGRTTGRVTVPAWRRELLAYRYTRAA
jgi:phytoene/squalene synthetase